jgi:TPR repeat protein
MKKAMMNNLWCVLTLTSAVLMTTVSHAELTSNVPEGSAYTTMPLPALQAAAKAGDMKAQFFLANRFKAGEGVPQDLTQAFDWYMKAAQKGAAPAQLNVGQMYARGRGVVRDMVQAKIWLQKAAKQGDNRASYNLALLEESNQNLSDAYQWYELSARDGMLDPRVKTEAQGKIRKLAANLSPEAIERARQRADQWMQDPQQ